MISLRWLLQQQQLTSPCYLVYAVLSSLSSTNTCLSFFRLPILLRPNHAHLQYSATLSPCTSSFFCSYSYIQRCFIIKLTYVVCPRIARICMVAAQTMYFSHRWVLNFLAVTLCWPSFLDLSVSAYHRPAGISIVHGFLFLPGPTNAQISHRKSNNLSNVQIEFQKSSNDVYQNPFNCSSVGNGFGKAAEFQCPGFVYQNFWPPKSASIPLHSQKIADTFSISMC